MGSRRGAYTSLPGRDPCIPGSRERILNPLNVGILEILVILVLALVLFGPSKLISVVSSLRGALQEFQRAAQGMASSGGRGGQGGDGIACGATGGLPGGGGAGDRKVQNFVCRAP